MPRPTSTSSFGSGAFHTPASTVPNTPVSTYFQEPQTAQLELVDDDNDDLDALPLPEDDETDGSDDHGRSSHSERSPTLSPHLVLLYLIAASLRLGALLLSDLDTHVSWKYTLPILIVGALITVISSQVWIRIARYVRKSTVADVVADALVGKDEGVKYRKVVKNVVKAGGIATNVVVCSVYLRGSSCHSGLAQSGTQTVNSFRRLPPGPGLPQDKRPLQNTVQRFHLAGCLCFHWIHACVQACCRFDIRRDLVLPRWPGAHHLCLRCRPAVRPACSRQPPVSKCLGSDEYVGMIFPPLRALIGLSAAVIQFTFASPFILPLFAAMARPPPVHTGKPKKRQSFTVLSMVASAISLSLLLPLLFLVPFRQKLKVKLATLPG